MRAILALAGAAVLTMLSACGGGSEVAVDVAPPAAPIIRFEVVYEPAGQPQNAATPGRYLTVRSLPGGAALGSRSTAKVELALAQEQPRALTAPTFVDAQGRANYVFAVSADYPANFQFRSCTSFLPFQVTVSDEAGLTFTKYSSLCPGQALSVGAFSDYGDRTVTFTVAGPPALVQAGFRRYGASGYVDNGSSTPAGGSATWTLRAAEGDSLTASAMLATAAAEGAVATADVTAEGGAFAHSVVAKNTAVGATFVDASLLCCRGAASAAQTVSLVVSPAQLGSIPGGVIPSVPFNVHYRVVDAASQRTTVEFEGQGAGYTTWTYQAKPGDQLFIEARSQSANTMLNVAVGSGSGASSVTLGGATSFLAGAAAKVGVICCSQPRP